MPNPSACIISGMIKSKLLFSYVQTWLYLCPVVHTNYKLNQ